MSGQLCEGPSHPGIDLVLTGEADDQGTAGSVGYVEGFASTFAVGTPRPADDVLTVGEDGP